MLELLVSWRAVGSPVEATLGVRWMRGSYDYSGGSKGQEEFG